MEQSKQEAFRARVQDALRGVSLASGSRATQRDLAAAVGLSPKELSLRLNVAQGKGLNADNVQAIVRQLVAWGALTTTAQAEELLQLAGSPSFTVAQWAAPPLAQLGVVTGLDGKVEATSPTVPTADLAQFRERVRELRRRADPYHTGRPPSQDDLASAIGLSPKELSARLNANSGRRLTPRDGRAIVRTLVEWGALTSRAEAEELLRLLASPSFTAAEWASHPLDLLTTAPPRSATPNNLSPQLTSFVGRERELGACRKLLAQHHLLTIVGPGGMGKTRLSLELAARSLTDFPDGVYFVALAELSDALLVPQVVASTLDLHESRGHSSTELLRDYLRGKRVLLVLDNCEHLADAAARLADSLLSTCPNLTLLATSREQLGVNGETTYNLDSLSLPQPGERAVAALGQHEAVALFVARATAAQAAFALTEENAAAVNQVCHLLDGIPLAIELAAPLVRALTPAQMGKRLGERLRLLTSDNRLLPSRQRTMRASIAWSYELLTRAEQTLFMRLSVFRGGWQLEAAEEICADDADFGLNGSTNSNPESNIQNLTSDEVLPVLVQLVNKSLVAAHDIGGQMRYLLLEVVREYALDKLNEVDSSPRRYDMQPAIRDYAQEKLAESATASAVQQRHLRYYLQLAAQGAAEMTGATQTDWLNHLEQEHSNLRAALDYSLGEVDDQDVLRLTVNLWRFWYMRGYLSEGQGWLQAALAKGGPRTPLRVAALVAVGAIAKEIGDVAAAHTVLHQALALARELGDTQGSANALNSLGLLAREQSEYAQANVYLRECLAIRQERADRRGVAATLSSLGLVADEQGDYVAAQQLVEASLTALRDLGDKGGCARVLRSLADIAMRQGHYDRAWATLEESLTLSRELGTNLGVASSLSMQGIVAQRQGDYETARRLLDEGLALMREVGHKLGVAQILDQLADVTFYQGDILLSAQRYRECLRLSDELDYKLGLTSALDGLAHVAMALGENKRGASLYAVAQSLREAFNITLDEYDQQARQGETAQLADVLGEQKYAQASAEGRMMGRAQAVAYASTPNG